MFWPLLFPIALGGAALLFRYWAFRQQIADPRIVMALGGLALLGLAVFTYIYAMQQACHGQFELRNAFACTYRAGRGVH